MANERTFLTYVRAALALVAFGLTLLQLHPERSGKLGYSTLATASGALVMGWLRFRHRRREIENCRVAA